MFHFAKRTVRRGLTLVELLVVIGVIVILMAIAIPAMRFGMEDRQVREASRAINAYLVAAQSRAAEKNRPVGVWFERRDGSPGESFRMFVAEVPPPYIGDTSDARAAIQPNNQSSFLASFTDGQSSLLPYLVSVGDVIRFDHKGPYYPITAINGGVLTCGMFAPADPRRLVPPAVLSLPTPRPVPFKLLRKAQKTSIASLELPKTTSIDLNVSGLGLNSGTWIQRGGVVSFAPVPPPPAGPMPPDSNPIVIMFSPSGRIDHLSVRGQIVVPTDTVHLLIGREDLVGEPNTPNLGSDQVLDEATDALTNLWISIGAQTGSITTAEIAATDPALALLQRVEESRKFANRKHLMGGG
jgi:prepilin-type N-terminal cleavage/methylation domain-containing protein